MEASGGRSLATERPPAPPLKTTARGEGAPASSRPGLGSDLEEAAAGSHAARSTQVSRRRLLPRERATAIARPSREEPGVTSSVVALPPLVGSGSQQQSRGTIRGSAQP